MSSASPPYRYLLHCSDTFAWSSFPEMNLLSVTVVLVLLVGAGAQVNVLRPQCDSNEIEEAALVAQDYLNSQHTHGYKFVLNRIEDVKILTNVSQVV